MVDDSLRDLPVDPHTLAQHVTSGSVLAIRYRDDPVDLPRIVHPQVLYADVNGRLRLEGIQVSGPSSGILPGWRQFEVAKLRSLATQQGIARRDPSLNLQDHRYATVFATCPQ